MKILIVSQFYPPDITAAAFRIGDMVSYLIDKNNEVRVITAEPHKGRLTSETSKDSSLIIRVPLAPIKTGGILNYIKQYGSFSIAALRVGISREIRQFSPDIVVATSPPLFVGITGWMLSIILNTKFVLDVRDIWPDSIVAAGQMRPNSLAWKITKYLEKFIYRKASLISSVTRTMGEYINKNGGKNVIAVYNGVLSTGRLPNSMMNKKKNKQLVYIGNIGHVQDIETLIKAFNDVNPNNWSLQIYGTGIKEKEMLSLVENIKASRRIKFNGLVERKIASRIMRQADVLYLGLINHTALHLTIPSKMFDYLQAGRPIIASIGGEGARILRMSKVNIVASPGNIEELKNAIRSLDSLIVDSYPYVEKNMAIVKKQFSRKVEYKKLEVKMQQLLEKL